MKHIPSRLRSWMPIIGMLSACHAPPEYSHRIFIRNESGDVVAIAQIAVPIAIAEDQPPLKGKWMLKTWEDEFPEQGTSAEDYGVELHEERFLFNLNPNWVHNNVLLTGESVGLMYLGTWCYQTSSGCLAVGTFEIVPIGDSEKQGVAVQVSAPPQPHAA